MAAFSALLIPGYLGAVFGAAASPSLKIDRAIPLRGIEDIAEIAMGPEEKETGGNRTLCCFYRNFVFPFFYSLPI